MSVRPLHSSISGRNTQHSMYGVWRSLELLFLLTYAAVFYFFLTRTSLQLASEYSSQNNHGRLWGLRKERFFMHQNDVSDSQWRNFRDNLPVLALVMAFFLIIANLIRAYFLLHGKGMARLLLSFSFMYIFYLHEACSIFLLIIAFGNYVIVKALAGRTFFPVVLWVYNLMFLVSNRVFEGYSFSSFGSALGYFDKHRGMQRWHICFNFVMLRMVSFGLDYHWACITRRSAVDLEKHQGNCDVCQTGTDCYFVRQEKSLSASDYSPENYFCYLFYPPLYIAGPIISFNAFMSQLQVPQKVYNKGKIILYGLRWIGCFMLMEIVTHYFYFNSLAISGVWQTLSPWEIFTVGYGVLNFMWLKFLLIWRFFRFWALVGGIEVVENMPRCINNCYDIEGFWKSWHASYNRWLVRYLYIPLGGSRWRFLNIWVVFTFVAIWHDLECLLEEYLSTRIFTSMQKIFRILAECRLQVSNGWLITFYQDRILLNNKRCINNCVWKLLSWAWVTCVLMAPEILVKSLTRSAMMRPLRESVIYRELCALGGALNITGLMTANLIGFVVGSEKMRWLLQTMIEVKNLPTTIGIFCSFYIGTKLMFHVQEFQGHREAFKQAD